jgi:ketosteroid isomerase-like protein
MRAIESLFLCPVILAFSTAAQADEADDPAAVRVAIGRRNVQYAEAVTRQDVPAFLSLFTDDATILYVGQTVKGKNEREQAAKEQLSRVKNPVLKTTQLDVRGDLAYEVGEYMVTGRSDGTISSGSYLVIWKQEKGGLWKIHVEATLPSGK